MLENVGIVINLVSVSQRAVNRPALTVRTDTADRIEAVLAFALAQLIPTGIATQQHLTFRWLGGIGTKLENLVPVRKPFPLEYLVQRMPRVQQPDRNFGMPWMPVERAPHHDIVPVSYTHLTLPTKA